MVTLKEIASTVGVSTATVSRVLNFDSTLSISAAKRQAIIETAEALNYETPRNRNRAAQQGLSKVALVHFDAHLDYAPFIHGLEYTNSHAFRHITRMPHVQSLTQVGIRSLRNTQTMMEDSLRDGNRIVTMEEFRDVSYQGFLDRIPRNARVYVSLDIDVLEGRALRRVAADAGGDGRRDRPPHRPLHLARLAGAQA